MRRKRLTYRSSGVSYALLDAFKRRCQKAAAKTVGRLAEVAQSRGESAYVWKEKDSYRAVVMEGLGTKNRIADEVRKFTQKSHYDAIAQDTVAAIVNDLIVVGAKPQVITAYFAVGSSDWFSDEERAKDLVGGWASACAMAGAAWGGGETPTLTNIVEPDTIDLAGSAVGIIQPKHRLTVGDKLKDQDAILLIESSGVHANGLTLARTLAGRMPKGYAATLPDGSTYGEALLTPTHIYARVIEDLFDRGIDIHYLVNITGHGWRKLMRVNRAFRYIIEDIGMPQPIFDFIKSHAQLTDRQMYATFNMGAGFAVFLPERDLHLARQIITRHHLHSWVAGRVEKGPKQIIIQPKGIIYNQNSLQLRS